MREKRPGRWSSIKPLDLGGFAWNVHEGYEPLDLADGRRLVRARGPVVKQWTPLRDRSLFDLLAQLSRASDEGIVNWSKLHGLPGSHLRGQQVGEDVAEIRAMAKHLDACTLALREAQKRRKKWEEVSSMVRPQLQRLCQIDVVALRNRLHLVLVGPSPFAAGYQRLVAHGAMEEDDPRDDYHWRALRRCAYCQNWFAPRRRHQQFDTAKCRKRGWDWSRSPSRARAEMTGGLDVLS